MPAIVAATAPYVASTFSLVGLSAQLPTKFRLLMEADDLPREHKKSFHALGSVIEFDVHHLLALAPLRHAGTAYTTNDAITKETTLWAGWLGAHTTGPLAGRLLVSGTTACNTGRQSEFSCSLGECVAAAVLTAIIGIPLAEVLRIPEGGNEGMDFRSDGSPSVAIEAKAAHGSCVAAKMKEISEQIDRQPHAKHRYGAIICYQTTTAPDLKKKGSYVVVYDPENPMPVTINRRITVIAHYQQYLKMIGFWSLVDALDRRMSWEPREHPRDERMCKRMLERIARFSSPNAPGSDARRSELVTLSRNATGICFDVANNTYFARAFHYLPDGAGSSDQPNPRTLLGVSLRVSQILSRIALGEDLGVVDELLLDAVRAGHSFSLHREGHYGPIHCTGLDDGTVRMDLVDDEQLIHERLDFVSPK